MSGLSSEKLLHGCVVKINISNCVNYLDATSLLLSSPKSLITAHAIPGLFGKGVKPTAGVRMSLLMSSHDRVAVMPHDSSQRVPK